MKYDVFVSYRRSSFESANLIAEKLRSMGYSVFFDVESLRSGNFNEQLFNVIDNCSDFVLVLPPNALDRCVNEDDWVRKEVIRAMQGKKNIIPVMLSGFTWPEQMPEQMQGLVYYQAITAGETEFFDMSMKRLATYLKCKPHKDLRKFYKKVLVGLAAVLVLVSIGMFALRQSMIPFCQSVSANMSHGMAVLNTLKYKPAEIMEHWENFIKMYNLCKTDEQRCDIYNRFNDTLDKLTTDVENLYQQYSTLPSFTSIDVKFLGYYDVPVQEIESFYDMYDNMFNDILHSLGTIRTIQEQKTFLDTDFLECQMDFQKLNFEMFSLTCDAFYYGYLEIMSKLPTSAQKEYTTRCPEWSNFPKNVGLDKSIDEYQQYQESILNEIQKVMLKMEQVSAKYEGNVQAYVEFAANK